MPISRKPKDNPVVCDAVTLHMKNVLRVAILVTTMAGWSCSKDYSDVVEDWKDDGWRVVDEFGEPGDYLHYTDLKSEKAKFVYAEWMENGQEKVEIYSQDTKQYLVLRFKKADGDVFAVVMSKRK